MAEGPEAWRALQAIFAAGDIVPAFQALDAVQQRRSVRREDTGAGLDAALVLAYDDLCLIDQEPAHVDFAGWELVVLCVYLYRAVFIDTSHGECTAWDLDHLHRKPATRNVEHATITGERAARVAAPQQC